MKCGVMASNGFGLLRKQQGKVTAKPGGIRGIDRAQTLDLGGIEDALNSSPDAAGRFGLGQPNWAKNAENKLSVDLCDINVVQLLRMIAAPPPRDRYGRDAPQQ